MLSPSPLQMLMLLAIVLLIFGARRIPEIARGLGQGARELRSAADGRDEPAATITEPEVPRPGL